MEPCIHVQAYVRLLYSYAVGLPTFSCQKGKRFYKYNSVIHFGFKGMVESVEAQFLTALSTHATSGKDLVASQGIFL